MSNRLLLVGTLIAGAGILWLVFGLDRPTLIYSRSVSEFLSRGPWDRRVRVDGVLVHKSLCKVDAECGYRFRLADSREQLSVLYDGCVLPDTFRDVPGLDVKIAVEGERCRSCHDFKAVQIMAKCPGKYEMTIPGSAPRAAMS